MYFHDSDGDHEWVSTLLDGLAPGSYVAITHQTADFDPVSVDGAVAAATHAGITLVPRSKSEVESFLTGLEMVEPGVVPVLS